MTEPLRVIVQARMNSARLPGKALLPIGGIPCAVLVALRAGSGGAHVVLATSDRPADDPLAAAAEAHGVQVFRGSLDDVLGRFVRASSDLPEDGVVVRLTGDNPVPDGRFVAMCVGGLVSTGADLVGSRWPEDGLPYGVSAEAMRVRVLRRAGSSGVDAYDREHVTPWLWRHADARPLGPVPAMPFAPHLRCTVDSLDDHLRMARAFDGLHDPVRTPWQDIVGRVADLPDSPRSMVPLRRSAMGLHSALVLGTAQIAAPYGSVLPTEPPTSGEAREIIRTAVAHGVTHIDTARAYAGSESRIGAALADGWQGRASVITKLDPLVDVPVDAPGWAVRARVDASVTGSCRELRQQRLDVVLLHRACHRTAWGGAVWRRLLELRSEGLIGRLGLSATGPDDVLSVLGDPDVTLLQLPANIVDHRWDDTGVPGALARRPDITVHARSAFLQGVLLRDPGAGWPRIEGLDSSAVARWLRRAAADLDRDGVADLCFAYLRAQSWIHGTVVGVERVAQLFANIELARQPALDRSQIAEVMKSRPRVPDRLLDPALWPAL